MFTGIIQPLGSIDTLTLKGAKPFIVLKVNPDFSKAARLGDSIAVNGVCLTVSEKKKNLLRFDIMPETIAKTTFRHCRKNDPVNLEKSLRIGDSIDGHFVQGHVDGIGQVEKVVKQGKSTVIHFSFPKALRGFIAKKGSITLNGTSLTVVDVSATKFSVSLVDYTLQNTTFGSIKKGMYINIEIDMMARYLYQLLKTYGKNF